MNQYYIRPAVIQEGIDVPWSAAITLVHNRIKFMADFTDGAWEFTVQKEQQNSLDTILTHLESAGYEVPHKNLG